MSNSPTASAAAELRAELARQRLTVRELASKMSMPVASVSRRLQGEQSLTVEDLVKFARALDVPATQFLPEGLLLADDPEPTRAAS